MQTTPTGGWREVSVETHLEVFHYGGKIRKSQALPSKEGKGDSTVYVCVCVRAHACVCTKRKQQLLRYLFNSQAAALRRKGSGVDFSPFI